MILGLEYVRRAKALSW